MTDTPPCMLRQRSQTTLFSILISMSRYEGVYVARKGILMSMSWHEVSYVATSSAISGGSTWPNHVNRHFSPYFTWFLNPKILIFTSPINTNINLTPWHYLNTLKHLLTFSKSPIFFSSNLKPTVFIIQSRKVISSNQRLISNNFDNARSRRKCTSKLLLFHWLLFIPIQYLQYNASKK